MSRSDLPPLDCHAHIAPDVTSAQVAGLGKALIWAMTRSPAEAHFASRRRDETILWGFGLHPGVPAAVAAIDAPRMTDQLAEQLDQFVVVGEIGLDRRGPVAAQRHALELVLAACAKRPVLLSLHSTGRTGELLTILRQQPHPGAVLHWFNGTEEQIAEAADLGCYFSVNNAMSDQRLAAIPPDRVLPETDFPSSRRTILASRPGDITALEQRLAQQEMVTEAAIRRRWYNNLGQLADAAGATNRLPSRWRQAIESAAG